jgi:hypothetical protein
MMHQQKLDRRASQTFMNRGAQSVHFGGLFGHGFAAGAESTFPFAENTYMSSAAILSFCTPGKGKQQRYSVRC